MFRSIVPLLLLIASTARAETPRVVADIAPVHSLVAQIMAGIGEPDLIVQHGATPHSYSLRPSEAAALEQADLVFWIGHALTPSLEGAIETLAADATVIELLDLPGTHVLPFRETTAFEGQNGEDQDADHMNDDARADHPEEDHEESRTKGNDHDQDHDHGGVDPHAWLDPANGAYWLDVIAGELARIDPDNAAAYRDNAILGKGAIATAVAEAQLILAPVRNRPFVVFHDAYQYYERAFGLDAAGAISLSDASDPSPARLDAIRRQVLDHGVTCVFSEPQFNPGLVRAVSESAGVSTGVLDPMGTNIATGPGFYPLLVTDLAHAMAACP